MLAGSHLRHAPCLDLPNWTHAKVICLRLNPALGLDPRLVSSSQWTDQWPHPGSPSRPAGCQTGGHLRLFFPSASVRLLIIRCSEVRILRVSLLPTCDIAHIPTMPLGAVKSKTLIRAIYIRFIYIVFCTKDP